MSGNVDIKVWQQAKPVVQVKVKSSISAPAEAKKQPKGTTND